MLKSSLRKHTSSFSSVAELSETWKYVINDWSKLRYRDIYTYDKKNNNSVFYFDSPEFLLCGRTWVLRIYPQGIDENDATHIAIKIVNFSNTDARIKYYISLINQNNVSDNYVWEDDEGIVKFEAFGGDCEWGSEDFLLFEDFNTFIYNDCIILEITMEVYGVVEIDAHPLTKAIENAAETEDLIALADKDLSLIVKQLPLGRQGISKGRQDSLIQYRLTNNNNNTVTVTVTTGNNKRRPSSKQP